MYIKEVELRNFKSFGKRVLVPFKNDFVTVTGPNGSGKSNIVDALLFALCLSSSRAMRAERLPDLIYKGDNGHNPDFAQVTVRLDNTSKTLPFDTDTIEISRKIKINKDKCTSAYFFNGKACSQGELQDNLSKAGITPETYNVVMQGDVTRIIEMSPTERRKIIDEIAGVAEFDEKKKKALDELDVVRERIGRVDVILGEVASQIGKLKGERDRALSYQAHRDELRRQEAFLLLAKLKEASDTLASLESEKAEIAARLEDARKRLDEGRAAVCVLDEQLKGLNSDICHKGEEEQIEVRRRIEELKGEIAREEGRLDMATKSLGEVDEGQRACFLQMDRLQAEAKALDDQMRDAGLRKAGLQGELDDQEEALSKIRSQVDQAGAQFSQLKDDLTAVRSLRENAKTVLADHLRERDRLLDGTRRGGVDRDETARAIAEAAEAITSMGLEADALRVDLTEMNSRAMEMERRKDDLERNRLSIRREMAEAEREIQRLQGEYARGESRLRSVEDRSGYSKAVEGVRSAMKRQMLKGLFGTISELGDADGKYSSALEVAAGARLQSVVAETDEDAARAIDYLKRSQIGRATFLPLNKLDRGSLPQKPRGPGIVDYAMNLVHFDSRFFPAFWYVFRDTLVVEDMNTARGMMGRYRMVTLEGDLVEKTGAMTGGHFRSRLKFAADEGKKLLDLSEKIQEAEGQRADLISRLDDAEAEVSKLSKEIDDLDKAISRKTFRLEEILAGIPKAERSLQEKEERLSQMEGESHRFKERLSALEEEIAKAEAGLRGHQVRIDGIEKSLEGSSIPNLTAQADATESEVRRLKERLSQMEAEGLKDRIRADGLAEKLKELSEKREALEARKVEASSRRLGSSEKIAALSIELQAAEARTKELDSELRGMKGRRSQILDRVLAAQRSCDTAEREVERQEARLTATDGASVATGSSVQALRAEIEACGVSPGEEPPKSDVVAMKIKALEGAMRDLEPVNMLAIDEYDRVDNRHGKLRDRRETLFQEREGIIEKLDRYDRMKMDAFIASFDEINRNFKGIFKDLSNGDGELILECPEDPLSGGMTIKARPAGKAFHRLEAMSGGEKSLTALSFIFAIQRHKPAPFYAMDEIDMFLDGLNVDRVAKLIKKISGEAQFIVVSLRKPMIQQAKYTIGVTMQENNISSATGICSN